MKKISLLLVMLLAYSLNTVAQSTVPVPADPRGDMFDWIDRQPYQWPDGTWSFSSEFDILIWNQDLNGNFVANDYPGWEAESELAEGETLEYTILDRDKLSFSLFTDMDEIFTFDPVEYEEFEVPTTHVPMTIFDGPNGDASSTYPHFAWDCIHFASQTNNVENIEGKDPFFRWRIGVQVHYTVGDVTTSSNIVYLEVFPKPAANGDVNLDGKVSIADVTALTDFILGVDSTPFSRLNADLVDDSKLSIADVTALIDMILNGTVE